ncbi:MAG: branched-chain amino acid aminotransferase [Flavobacteriales bacterium Tduv]
MKIEKTPYSRISQVDFKHLGFGRYCSDHMLCCTFKDNQWKDSVIKPFGDLTVSPTCLAFHYGQAIFEGMKAYKDRQGKVFLFRPEENFKRINRSAQRMEMPEIPEKIFMENLKILTDIDRDWVPIEYGQSLYLRPFMIATGNVLVANPSKEYLFIIISSPSGAYYEKPLKIKVEQKYSRSAHGGIGFTKTAGNYAASFHPTRLAQEKGYDQILWTDSSSHTLIEESGTMNVFFYLEDRLITPPAGDSILGGITRKSIIELARKEGIKVQERNFSVSEMIDSLKKGLIKEAFGCGTAVVTNVFKIIGYEDVDFYLPDIPNNDRISFRLKKRLLDIQHNLAEDPFSWRVEVKNKQIT